MFNAFSKELAAGLHNPRVCKWESGTTPTYVIMFAQAIPTTATIIQVVYVNDSTKWLILETRYE